jgi:hypothetical protein
MMAIDRLVVQRTWGLHQRELASVQGDSSAKARSYGPKFRYTEFVVIPGGKLGGLLFSVFVFVIGMGMMYSPVRFLSAVRESNYHFLPSVSLALQAFGHPTRLWSLREVCMFFHPFGAYV